MKKEVEFIGENCCEWCGELLKGYDEVAVKDSRVYHTSCIDSDNKGYEGKN